MAKAKPAISVPANPWEKLDLVLSNRLKYYDRVITREHVLAGLCHAVVESNKWHGTMEYASVFDVGNNDVSGLGLRWRYSLKAAMDLELPNNATVEGACIHVLVWNGSIGRRQIHKASVTFEYNGPEGTLKHRADLSEKQINGQDKIEAPMWFTSFLITICDRNFKSR